MKKLLSVLLSALMIISCLSVGLAVFAEDAEPTEAEALITKINDAIEVATTEEYDENGNITRHTAGYWYGRSIRPMDVSVDGDAKNYLGNLLKSQYPEYSAFTIEVPLDEEGHTRNYPDFSAIGTYILAGKLENAGAIDSSNAEALYNSLEEATALDKQVRKNSDAYETLEPDDVLRQFEIDPETVESVEDENTLVFKDIDIFAGDKVADSVIPVIASVYPDLTGISKGIIKKAGDVGLKMENYVLKYTNIKLTAEFDGDKLMGLKLSYDITASADMTFNAQSMTLQASSVDNKIEYYGFEYFDEGNEFDYAELVRMINEGTARAVNSRTGYEYTRSADTDNNQAIKLDLTADTYEALSGLSDSAQQGIFGVIDQVTVAIDNLAGTSITKYEWVCDGENCPICASNPVDADGVLIPCKEGDHSTDVTEKWVCKGNDCPVCSQHQDNDTGEIIECENNDWMEPYVREQMPWLDDDQVREEVESMKERCTCTTEEVPTCTCSKRIAPHNLSIEVMGNTYDVNMLLDKGINAITGKLNDTQKDSLTKLMELGTYHATVPESKNPDEYIEPKYALKATSLTVNDLDPDANDPYEVMYEDGVISFYIPHQENPDYNSALAHLTDDFVTGEDFKAATAEALTQKIDGDVINSISSGIIYSGNEAADPDDPQADVNNAYSPIKVQVAFKGATDDNIYGNGDIDKLIINYTCYYEYGLAIANFLQIAEATYSSHTDSSYIVGDQPEYEKGDADLSGRVSIIDAKLVLKHIVGTEYLNEVQQEVSDMNNDQEITVVDAKMILQKIAEEA